MLTFVRGLIERNQIDTIEEGLGRAMQRKRDKDKFICYLFEGEAEFNVEKHFEEEGIIVFTDNNVNKKLGRSVTLFISPVKEDDRSDEELMKEFLHELGVAENEYTFRRK